MAAACRSAGGHRAVEQSGAAARRVFHCHVTVTLPRLALCSRSFQLEALIAVVEPFIPPTHALTPFHSQLRKNTSMPAHGLCTSKVDEQWKTVDGGLRMWRRSEVVGAFDRIAR
jgi:hypothetical protein